MVDGVRTFLASLFQFSCAAVFTLLAGNAMADIENTATASANYGLAGIQSLPAHQSVLVTVATPSVRLTKTIDRVEDTNTNNITDAGDTVFYSFVVLNTGNLTLDQVEISDLDALMDVTTIGPILPKVSDATLSASYVLTQSDLDAGEFENSATAIATLPDWQDGTARDPIEDISDVGSEDDETPNLVGEVDNDPTIDPTVLEIDRLYDLTLTKRLTNTENIYPSVYDLTYEFVMTDVGSVTATDLVLQDDIVNNLPDVTVVFARTATVQRFNGTGALNLEYDGNKNGSGDLNILSGGVTLAPSESGTANIVLRLELSPESFGKDPIRRQNQATVNASGLLKATESFDPVTATNIDTGPTVAQIRDSDADGAPDDLETVTSDRDGDGIFDAYNYDPTGYFYCEETGEVLSLTSPDQIATCALYLMGHRGFTSGLRRPQAHIRCLLRFLPARRLLWTVQFVRPP